MLLSHLACCLMVAYSPAMTPNAHGASSPLLVGAVVPTAPNPEITGGDLAAPPGPFYAPRLICTAIARLGGGIELLGKTIERCSILVSNGAGNVTGTLAWLLALLACSRVQKLAPDDGISEEGALHGHPSAPLARGPSAPSLATPAKSRTQACSPLFLIASSMASIGRTARTLAERSYASASGGSRLPLAASVFALPTPKNVALRARMQADIDKGRMDREEGQRLAMQQMLERSTRSAPPGGQPISGAAPPVEAAPPV